MAQVGSQHEASAASTKTVTMRTRAEWLSVDLSPAAADITVLFKDEAGAERSETITIPSGASKTFHVCANSAVVTRAAGATAFDIYWEPDRA